MKNGNPAATEGRVIQDELRAVGALALFKADLPDRVYAGGRAAPLPIARDFDRNRARYEARLSRLIERLEGRQLSRLVG